METEIKNILAEIKNLVLGQKDLAEKMDNNHADIKKTLADEIASCNRNTARVETKVNLPEVKVDSHIDAERRRLNLILNGIPFKTSEDIVKLFCSFSSLIGFKEAPEAKFYRFNGNDNNKRPIIIKFPTEFQKDDFMHNYINVADKLLLNAIPGFSKKKERIYLQHDLSPSQYKVNKTALKYRKEGIVKKIRIINGNIGVKFGNDVKFSFFSCAADLVTATANRNK